MNQASIAYPYQDQSGQQMAGPTRDSTQTEVITERLRATLSTMVDYNGKMSESLDRLNGGMGATDGAKNPQPPVPSDFVGCVTSLLDDIGRELGRMENNGARLARLA